MKLKYKIGVFCSSLLMVGCNDFLEEKPLDFYSPENSMVTIDHFNSSLNYLYNQVRRQLVDGPNDMRFPMFYATDFAFNATDYYTPAKLNNYRANMVPTSRSPKYTWKELYSSITNANVILNRLSLTNQLNEQTKAVIEGEAKFFRAYSYRCLAHLFGGVPLSLEEVTTPRRDFVRASREEVYQQCKKDFEDAAHLLPNIEDVKPGKVSKQLAQHFLSEINISLGLYDEAITAASAVINHPEVSLMTERFGKRSTEEGDVYWDLFREGNQNRTSGNTEGLWVLQYDYENEGSKKSSDMPWRLSPCYYNVMITEKDATGKAIKVQAFDGFTDGKGGRSIGWMQPTKYFYNDIWEKGSKNDIRNSKYNIIRDMIIDNPASPAFGKWLVKDGYIKQVDPIRLWYPIITKAFRVGNFPKEQWLKDNGGNPIKTQLGEQKLLKDKPYSYKDEYLVRLAETYLLRAEAYLNKGDKVKCADDINIIRSRAHAELAAPDEMDIDYILDERLRELYAEEFRMITLCRLGKLVERNRAYNPVTGKTIDDYHNLWPIPYDEIERNTESTITQNPGY